MNHFNVEKLYSQNRFSETEVRAKINPIDLPMSLINPERAGICRQNIEILKVQKGLEAIDSSKEKGNFGEMLTDIDLKEKGFERISHDRVTDLDQAGHSGIDGVYYNKEKKEYLIAESKYGLSQLGETLDGRQMSWEWIDARLDDAVGKNTADKIREQYAKNPEKVHIVTARISGKDNISYSYEMGARHEKDYGSRR